MASSCSGLLESETKSSFDESVVFSNYSLAEYNIFSITEVYGHTNVRGRLHPWYGYNNDVEYYVQFSSDKPNDEKGQIALYSMLSTNSQMNLSNGPYNELFVGVERANLCISNLRKYGDIENKADMASLLGEALVLRAQLYCELLRCYGEVPARFEPITSEGIYVNKSDKDVIYKQLLADLLEAKDYLPWPGNGSATKTDRVSKAFAEGLYARLALMASGYSQRPEDGKVGTGDDGSVRLSNDPELSKETLYPTILAVLKDCIANSGLSLYSDYEQLWRDFNNFDLTAGKEVIYSIPYGDVRGRWNYTFAVRANQGCDVIGNAGGTRGGQAGPVPTLYYAYGSNDVRRDVSVARYEWDRNGNDDIQVLASFSKAYFGKYRYEWMEKVPYGGGNDDGIKPVCMRYSDILLMAAEVANELGETDYAKEQLLKVRKRAYKGNESQAQAYVNGLSGQEAIFNAIVDERALEFVGEFLRKSDLIRWNLLTKKMDETKANLTAYLKREGQYGNFGPYVYYRYASDGKTIETYGLENGQLTTDVAPGEDWLIETTDSGAPKLYIPDESSSNYGKFQILIDNFYQADPNTRQWWPIPSITITNAQGALHNDYGYSD